MFLLKEGFYETGFDVGSLVEHVKTDGCVRLQGVISREKADYYIQRLQIQLEERLAENSYCGNHKNQVLDNYFQSDSQLTELIYQPVTDAVMRILIDDDYVLISPSARNRRVLDREFGKVTSGVVWHTDSRFIGGQGIRPSLGYTTVICLDDFREENGATRFIPKSHLRYERPQDRGGELTSEYMRANKGDMIVLDTALWHKVGQPSKESRWGVFNMYGPWFMKPYHRFDLMFDELEKDKLPPIIRQLLHLDSLTPMDHNESMTTLRRVRNIYD